ncbi:MAG: hypothetical protein MI802_03470, partial [Desulfobacterales bacterium]|nr:hypothetical protein [Desulfobacterales bacterium]
MHVPSVQISTPHAYDFQGRQIIQSGSQNNPAGGKPASIVDLNSSTKVDISFMSSKDSLQYNGGSFEEWKKNTYNIAFCLFNCDEDALDSEGWDKFYNAALNSGDFIEVFFLATQDLYDFSNESEAFMNGFLNLTAGLSDEGLADLFSIYKNSPGDMMATVETALKLEESEVGFTSFLAAANNSGRDINEFNAAISNQIHMKMEKETLGSFLDAAAKTGTGVMTFVDFSKNLNAKDLRQVSDYILNGLTGADLDNFLQLAGESKETGNMGTLLDLVDFSQSLSGESKSRLLESALHTRDNGARLIKTAERLNEDLGRRTMDDFLSTAANAEDEIGTLIDQVNRIDLRFTSELSKADTIHFLQTARFAGPLLGSLSETADGLNGEEKHLFLYAAAKTGNKEDLSALVKNVETLEGEDLSQFLLKSANKGWGTLDETIYMTS